ncbi:hypothetical protein VFMJ11_0838 [Aliivibrio fischeri MJ11]|uniref:Uncharacterized protein n=1 Tax=Aliivibrio fischeri (strain MJ11) TaxID=388396 RepID=B5FC03_ALIFM|nr:hypothetical protein VFMJ11_0838 [Aliivibrio fischeri MJ11]
MIDTSENNTYSNIGKSILKRLLKTYMEIVSIFKNTTGPL